MPYNIHEERMDGNGWGLIVKGIGIPFSERVSDELMRGEIAVKRVNVLLATCDGLYCERIEEYIQEFKFPMELVIITDKEYFAVSSDKEKADIVLVSPEFMDSVGADFFQKAKVFVLSHTSMQGDNLKHINPYQKTESFLREVMLKYGEISGETAFFMEEKKKRKIISFYSPCGGSGKTALSLALSGYLSQSGKKVFYLNLDALAGINTLFAEQERGGFSNVILSLKQSIANQSLMAISRNMKKERSTQIMYFSDLENPCDLDELGTAELEALLKQMSQLNEIDLLVLDLESTLTEKVKTSLALSDFVFIPILDTFIGREKAEKLMEAAGVSGLLEGILKKSAWVINQRHGRIGAAMMQEWSSGMDCFTVAKCDALDGAQRVGQIYEILNQSVRAMAEKVLEGCESV